MAVRPQHPPPDCPVDAAGAGGQLHAAAPARPPRRHGPRPAALLAAQLRWQQLREELEGVQETLRMLAAVANASQAQAGDAAGASSPNATSPASSLDDVATGALAALANMTGAAGGTALAALEERQQALQLQAEQALLDVGAAADPAGVGAMVQRLRVGRVAGSSGCA
jgi:hypothetical protein